MSVESLANLLGGEIRSASVPGGYYTNRVARATADAEIAALFTPEPVRTTQQVWECRVGRFSVSASTSAVDASWIAAGDSRPWLREWVGWNLRRPAKAMFGEVYETFRGSVLSHRPRAQSQ